MANFHSPGHRALRRGRQSLPNGGYLLTTTTWQRRAVFADFLLAAAACRAFTAATPPDARLLAWVLMPDHVHWLVQLGSATSLADTVSRMKACGERSASTSRGGLEPQLPRPCVAQRRRPACSGALPDRQSTAGRTGCPHRRLPLLGRNLAVRLGSLERTRASQMKSEAYLVL
nr:transposase [Xanthomonas dyei]